VLAFMFDIFMVLVAVAVGLGASIGLWRPRRPPIWRGVAFLRRHERLLNKSCGDVVERKTPPLLSFRSRLEVEGRCVGRGMPECGRLPYRAPVFSAYLRHGPTGPLFLTPRNPTLRCPSIQDLSTSRPRRTVHLPSRYSDFVTSENIANQ
jgi:hypothetical protein